jgi:dihydroorotate dehydrogenase electron transfer subunit
MIQANVQVLWNNQVGPCHYKIGLNCPREFASAIAGQFIMLRIADQMDPLLRRPFSIHKLILKHGQIDGVELIYKVIGVGTGILSELIPGDRVNVLGPLGNGFMIPDHAQRILIVAGGMGVAPMPFLISHLIDKGLDLSNCKVFLGAKSKDELLCREAFVNLGISVHTSTDDGSLGEQCSVTDPLEIEITQSMPDIIYACGPMEMLACVIGIAEKHHISCQVSIETMMACGVGACLGCAVESRNQPQKYFHACLDGPVFDAHLLRI